MRHGVIVIAQNEIENFCNGLFEKLKMDFEERSTTVNLIQGSFYKQMVTKYAYDNTRIHAKPKEEVITFERGEEQDVCEEGKD